MARRKSRIRGLNWDRRIQKWVATWRPAVEELTPSGRVRRQSKVLGADYETAEIAFREILRNVELEKAGLGSFSKQNLALSFVRDKYLADLKTRASERHFKHVRSNLKYTMDRLKARTVAALTVDQVLQVRQAMRDERDHKDPSKRKNRTETVNKKIKALIACLNWAERTDLITRNPIGGGKIPALDTTDDIGRERHVLTRDEWRHLIAAAEADDKKQAAWHERIPQAPLFRVLMGTGFRLNEACLLRWSYLGKFEGRWRIVLPKKVTKTKVDRTNPISDDLAQILNALRAEQGRVIGKLPGQQDFILLSPNGHPWAHRNCSTNINARLNRIISRVESKHPDRLRKRYDDGTTIDMHSFRHTYCTWLRAAGVSYDDARDLMGHSSDHLTRKIYTREDSLDHVKAKAIDKLTAFENEDVANRLSDNA